MKWNELLHSMFVGHYKIMIVCQSVLYFQVLFIIHCPEG